MPFDADAAKVLIESAVKEFLREPKNVELLKRGRVERTCAGDLATKLKPLFETEIISVDAPYNRHHNATKYLGGKVIELDLAIHERGKDENNLVAIELETNNNPECDDVWKLEGLTAPLGGYGYKLGLFLVFGIGDNTEGKAGQLLAMDWYAEGKKL